MRDFYRGWRRKVGIVTLVMACVFMGVWVRSLVYLDIVYVQGLGHFHELISTEGTVHWIVRDGSWDLASRSA